MTGSDPGTRDAATRPISVAELLAKNGNIGSPPVTGRRRRHRGNSNAVTVAELTGEIPVIRDDSPDDSRDKDAEPDRETPPPDEQPAPAVGQAAEPAVNEANGDRPVTPPPAGDRAETAEQVEQQGPWPKSVPRIERATGPEHSHYPRPVRRSDLARAGNGQPSHSHSNLLNRGPAPGSGAEQISPPPADTAAPAAVEADAVDTTGADVDVADPPTAGPKLDAADLAAPADLVAPVTSLETGLETGEETDLAGLASLANNPAVLIDDDPETDLAADLEADLEADLAGEPVEEHGWRSELAGGALIVFQSILAVVFGAGLFIAFDQLWRWNNIVALVLTVLVTLGLVAAVQAVRKTVDIGSTLIAVGVGLLITLGPLALHAN